MRDAEEALSQVTTAKSKLADIEASKAAEDQRLEEILEGLKEATQGLRDTLEITQAELADAMRATSSIQVSVMLCHVILFFLTRPSDALRPIYVNQHHSSASFPLPYPTSPPLYTQTEKESAETALQLLRSRSDTAVQAVSATETKMSNSKDETLRMAEKKAALEAEKKDLSRRVSVMEAQVLKAAEEEITIQSR